MSIAGQTQNTVWLDRIGLVNLGRWEWMKATERGVGFTIVQ